MSVRKPSTALDRAVSAVLKVGDGRGFVIETPSKHINKEEGDRYVITAGHCLPHLPPSMTFSHTHERTYRKLIGPLGKKGRITAECLFVDPIADIAVLGGPDNQVYYGEADAYNELIQGMGVLRIGRLPYRADRPPHLQRQSAVWLLKLDGAWMQTSARPTLESLWLSECKIQGGMSGSPVVKGNGDAVGVVSTGGGLPTSYLPANLPGWLAGQAGTGGKPR